MKKKSIPEKIAEIVKDDILNSEQIAKRIKLKEDPVENKKHVRTYINRALNYDLIKIVRKEGRLNYYSAEIDSITIHEMELKRLIDEQKICFYAQKYLKEIYALTELTEENSEIMKTIEKFLKFLEKRKEWQFETKV